MSIFKLTSPFEPDGDQPRAIEQLSRNVLAGIPDQVLLGVTGSGKTFTMAQVIAQVEKPTLVIAPNKTLAAQLYAEFKSFFPDNAVEYFVSYYDYYQPEAYIPTSDTYIEKDSSINEMIDKLRHSATRSVISRRDVIVVASVSCIFGLGAPENYLAMRVDVEQDQELTRDKLLRNLVDMQYERNDMDFHRGVFRVRGDRVEVFPAYEEDAAIRIEFFGDQIDNVAEIDPLRGVVNKKLSEVTIFPASHYVTEPEVLRRAVDAIVAERKQRVQMFRDDNRLIEAQRVEERTNFDLEMLMELGYCHGIENYARHFTGRAVGEPPPTLLDYFADDFLIFLDECHMAVPQLNGMYRGDRSRKETLVRYGFRLPSALDNRPLKFEEFEARRTQIIYVSATPADYELEKAKAQVNAVVEQIVRPTGLIDPEIQVREARNQVDDLLDEITQRIKRRERVLVTTLTKRMSEDLTEYYAELGIQVRYLHSDISTLERMDIIQDLRAGKFDVLIGINLLREGLDIPEVSLVAILDADKEGFLRSARSLIQTCGRASRNLSGTVIMYADRMTAAMNQAIEETDRRRKIQTGYNHMHGITPTSVKKEIVSVFEALYTKSEDANQIAERTEPWGAEGMPADISDEKIEDLITRLEGEMKAAAKDFEFERAAELRDRIKALRGLLVFT